jgi:hypothetical protein
MESEKQEAMGGSRKRSKHGHTAGPGSRRSGNERWKRVYLAWGQVSKTNNRSVQVIQTRKVQDSAFDDIGLL